MLEIPEAKVLADQLSGMVQGKRIIKVIAGYSPHKFTWYYGEPEGYDELLNSRVIQNSVNYGGMVQINADGAIMVFGDGVGLRYQEPEQERPKKHQLLLEFEDGSFLYASVQMYGGIMCSRKDDLDNPYYATAKEKPSPLSNEFNKNYFDNLINNQNLQKLSTKALLATEQRIPGLGNGVLQDILYNAGIHPKTKISELSITDKDELFHSIKSTLLDMTMKGGRDTERDLFGCLGGYKTKLSKNTVGKPCEACGETIKKASYMGGSIYFCEGCQPV